MINLKNISVTFSKGSALENKALRQINLNILRGDFITLIGGNGAGKSTLVNLLAGEVFPDQGEIVFDDINITKMSVEHRAKFISRVFQDPRGGVCEDFTIEENMALAAKRGMKRGLAFSINQAQREKFKVLLSNLGIGLEDRLNEQAGLLSGGERQALSLIMATLLPSKLLLLDEHTAALDPAMEKVVIDLTKKIVAQYQLTTIMVTHSMSHALEIGNRTLLMKQGEIKKDLTGIERSQLKSADLIDFF